MDLISRAYVIALPSILVLTMGPKHHRGCLLLITIPTPTHCLFHVYLGSQEQ